ncbi:MAG TPA: protease modulator HflC [Candidatus Paceibacterota bacterium]|nr:protease modulator HflC [Candidatus Paceibacterota bacterium]
MEDTEMKEVQGQSYVSIAWKQIVLLLVAALALSSTFYTISEGERVVITRFGDPIADHVEAGLYMKRPFFDTVNELEKRLFIYDAEPKALQATDKKYLVVDLTALLYVKDGVLFLRKVGNVSGAIGRADNTLYSQLRDVLGNVTLQHAVGEKRDQFMEQVAKGAEKELAEFGIGLAVLVSSRTDLPEENKASVFGRMEAERARIAAQYRAEGEAEKSVLIATTDREYAVITSTARAKGETIRGEGDAGATAIYTAAYGKDPEFFRFYRGLETAMRTTGKGEDTRFFLSGKEPHLAELFGNK